MSYFYEQVAACSNEKCPARYQCRRFQMFQNQEPCSMIVCFAPKSKYASKCKVFLKAK